MTGGKSDFLFKGTFHYILSDPQFHELHMSDSQWNHFNFCQGNNEENLYSKFDIFQFVVWVEKWLKDLYYLYQYLKKGLKDTVMNPAWKFLNEV